MMSALRPSALVPSGFHVDSAAFDGAITVLMVSPVCKTSCCPDRGELSGRVRGRYSRRLANLPLSGRSVRLIVVARRFRCDATSCPRGIFTERFGADVVAPWARRTERLDGLFHYLGAGLARESATNNHCVPRRGGGYALAAAKALPRRFRSAIVGA